MKFEEEYVFIEEMHGIGKKSNKPYHFMKLACPISYQNHLVSYDPAFVNPDKFDLKRGQKVLLAGRLDTPFDNTGVIITSVKAV